MKKLLSLILITTLMGCSAIYSQMSNSELQITTNMTKTIWLTPTNPENTSIFIQTRNTSDNQDFNDLNTYIAKSLKEKGYLITTNPDNATFILQANVLKAILTDGSISEDKATSDAVFAGAGVGYAVSRNSNDTKAIAAGLATGLITMYANAKTKNATYIVQTDIRILENGKPHTTVLNVSAKQVNLTVNEASNKMKEAISNSLSGLF